MQVCYRFSIKDPLESKVQAELIDQECLFLNKLKGLVIKMTICFPNNTPLMMFLKINLRQIHSDLVQ